MAFISFALTTAEFLAGRKTVTRRVWAERHTAMWQSFWDRGMLIHDAWDKAPFAKGKAIGKFLLTERPYMERLRDMPVADLAAEGGMCETLEEFYALIGMGADDWVTVVRFERVGEKL